MMNKSPRSLVQFLMLLVLSASMACSGCSKSDDNGTTDMDTVDPMPESEPETEAEQEAEPEEPEPGAEADDPTSTVEQTNAKTMVDRNGEIIRGTPIALGKAPFSAAPFALSQNPATWVKVKEMGLNTVRIAWIDPWYRREGNDHYTVDEILPFLDKCVENATAAGVNIIINYHDVAEYQKTQGFGIMAEFWEAVAPRYKNNNLVFYELNNEQVWSADAYKSEAFKGPMKTIYDKVRTDAPYRHIILFSFHSLALPMKSIVDDYDWIDFDFTTVGFHLYGSGSGDISTEEANMLALVNNYRTICTEWSYPGEFDYIKTFFGKTLMAEVAEDNGIGWADWRSWNDGTFDEYEDILVPDAKEKEYWWGEE